jgi:hypothetical protein
MNPIQAFLRQRQILSIRRNHAVEHATIHILSKQHPTRAISGYSDTRGFWIIGPIPGEDVRLAVDEAIKRLQGGESRLAYHPNCGTNIVTTGVVTGFSAWIAMLGSGKKMSDKIDRLPMVFLLSTLAVIMAQPLAYNLQVKGTTTSDLGEFAIRRIEDVSRGAIQAFRVFTYSV